MRNELTLFDNESFGKIRTVEKDGEVYFVAKDVAKALGYKDEIQAINQHCRRPTVKLTVDSNSRGNQKTRVIQESDVYRLIFKSTLPAADAFLSWVTEEVLPSIRKHGLYVTEELLADNAKLQDAIVQLKEDRRLAQEETKLLQELSTTRSRMLNCLQPIRERNWELIQENGELEAEIEDLRRKLKKGVRC